jgi:hypothetical protein
LRPQKPDIAVIDSIQTIYSDTSIGAGLGGAGAVECARAADPARSLAAQHILVSHVTRAPWRARTERPWWIPCSISGDTHSGFRWFVLSTLWRPVNELAYCHEAKGAKVK